MYRESVCGETDPLYTSYIRGYRNYVINFYVLFFGRTKQKGELYMRTGRHSIFTRCVLF